MLCPAELLSRIASLRTIVVGSGVFISVRRGEAP